MFSSGNNSILITGGGTGIGFALAKEFLNDGNEVIITGRRIDVLNQAKEKLNSPKLHIHQSDVSTAQEREELVKFITTSFPQLNVVVWNAGIQKDVNLLHSDKPWEFYREEIAVNLDAPIHLSQLISPYFQKVDQPTAIITVSSGLAFVPFALYPIYCATKAALHSFSLSLRHQLRNTKISVIELIPPAVDSELNKEGRDKRNAQNTGTTAEEYAQYSVQKLKEGELEFGFKFSESSRKAPRQELDGVFAALNKVHAFN